MTHPFDDKEHFEKIAEVYLGEYSWSIACVWRDKATGRLYGATDVGCSCYGPFDEVAYNGVGDLIEITSQREAAALLDDAAALLDEDEPELSTTDRQGFVRAVGVALAG